MRVVYTSFFLIGIPLALHFYVLAWHLYNAQYDIIEPTTRSALQITVLVGPFQVCVEQSTASNSTTDCQSIDSHCHAGYDGVSMGHCDLFNAMRAFLVLTTVWVFVDMFILLFCIFNRARVPIQKAYRIGLVFLASTAIFQIVCIGTAGGCFQLFKTDVDAYNPSSVKPDYPFYVIAYLVYFHYSCRCNICNLCTPVQSRD